MGRDWYRGSAKKDTHSSGCFTAVFHVFDLHRPLFPVTRQSATTGTGSGGYGCFQPHDSIISPQTTVVKGAEAPRNSSETEEEEASSSSFKLQIKTRRSKAGAGDNETCSPGTKSPTLVARLMGLDLLPQNETPSSPSLSSTLNFRHRKSLDGHMGGGTRSSSARRSDMDHHHHHLSLQINKENMSPTEDLVVSRLSSLKKELKLEEDNRSGRLTVKQVKQSVGSRKVGSDITNKVRKSSTKAQPVNGLHKRQPPKTASRCNEKFSSRLKRQEEPFVRPSTVNRVNITDRKCRKTRLSNELGHAKIPQKQVLDAQKPKLGSQLSSCSSQMYKKQEATHVHSDRETDIKVLLLPLPLSPAIKKSTSLEYEDA
ncbi:uncharacterized protein LOC120172152 [Hibiscus syriacus]|uniref:uncharacterized protein LOC120172152 n=1 Tax=Hibiscus syriacus TaxID=106335 RepID=UPI001920FFCF|nr:uncharacterized protein LOC120172152 [Hibiscus syriacus]